MRRYKLLALVLATSLLAWSASILVQNRNATSDRQDLCHVLYALVARSGASVGKPGSPGYAYYHTHPAELQAARRQNQQFLDQLPCQP